MNKKLELRVEDGFRYYAINLETKGLNISVGIEEETHDLIQQRELFEFPPSLRSKLSEQRGQEREENYSLGSDGIIVKYRD